MLEKNSNIIGIDLGTTNSLCSIFRDNEAILINNSFSDYLNPSVVGFLSDASVLVGDAAKELQISQSQMCAQAFKRWMGTDKKVDFINKDYNAAEL